MKSTRVVIRANGGSWMVTGDHQNYTKIGGEVKPTDNQEVT